MEYECLFNETSVQWVPLEMVYERFDVAQPEVVGEDESSTFVVVFGWFMLLC